MTNSKKQSKEPRAKIEISRRQTSGKKKPDLFAKFRNDEHPLDGIVPESKSNPTLDYPSIDNPTLAQVATEVTNLPETSGRSDEATSVVSESVKQVVFSELQTAVSPNKNFTKVSNSVFKRAIPDGLFRGQSKHTYDVLYQTTRGAINPKREVQLKKSDLVRLTGLEMKTIQRHLSFLRSVGLIIVDPKIGDHKGAIYQVKVPEELTLPYPTLPQTTVEQTGIPESGAKRVPNPSINSTTLGQGNLPENKDLTKFPKTSFKTNTNDDESIVAFSRFIERFENASEKLTGKKISEREVEKWEALAEILILELEVAAKRSGSISSVPAFLTEVLRRQFFSVRQNKTAGNSSAKPIPIKPDTVGKSDSETFEIKPLNKPGREAAFEQLREFAGESFLEDFEKWYTPEDWLWLKKQIDKIESRDGILSKEE